ncbi:OmpA family protein [Photobacterium swingsii]|uniref:OmpA family protein n=1 Tax=Photobacterium swingsii TaxID=680026 RepID=UPI003D115694
MNLSMKLLCTCVAFGGFSVHASCVDIDNSYNHTISVVSKTEITTQVSGRLLNKDKTIIKKEVSSDKIVNSETPFSNDCFYNSKEKKLTLIYGFDDDKLLNKHKISLKDYLSNKGKVISIEIEGHADSIGDSKYNVMLSSRRANNVAQYIRSDLGMNVQVSMTAYGESKPTCSSEVNKRNGCNRRVSLTVMK